MKTHRKRNRTRGQALVEFALILPIFVLVLVGLVDLGRAVYAFNTVSNAAREGVRVGIVNQSEAAIQQRAVDHASGLGLQLSDVDVDFLQPDYTDAAPCNAAPRFGCVVEVEVNYHYTAATPILGNLIGPITITGDSRQQIERTHTSP